MSLDCLLIVPPFSSNDATPPLGSAILKAHCCAMGYSAVSCDLNIKYIETFSRQNREGQSNVIGDHDNDEQRVAEANDHFVRSLRLPPIKRDRIPSCDDPNSSLPHSFEELELALATMEADGEWLDFADCHVFDVHDKPRIVGFSIMGPAQVPLTLLLARLSRRRWPGTLIVAGGSHVTLLAPRIASDRRYGTYIDLFLPGHSEDVLVNLLRIERRPRPREVPGVLHAGTGWDRAVPVPPDARLPPLFETAELGLYQNPSETLPIHFGRGCAYGRCTYCTYPAVEEFERVSIEGLARRFLPALIDAGAKSVSVKDSLFTLPQMDAFSAVVEEQPIRLKWSATTKVTSGIAERAPALYDAGCRTVEIGIESIHPNSQAFLDKRESIDAIERVLESLISAKISVVVNLIYGIPSETLADAWRQFEWWESWQRRLPGRIFGVHSMLQVDEASPLARNPRKYGLVIETPGPWSYTYVWNAPPWREEFDRTIRSTGGRSR